jgi:hypothetical protein
VISWVGPGCYDQLWAGRRPTEGAGYFSLLRSGGGDVPRPPPGGSTEYLVTSAPEVYTAGDVANVFHPRYGVRIRLEHWSVALNQGPAAAENMLGQRTAHERTPYFFSDQYDFGTEYRGFAPKFDEVVFKGEVARAGVTPWEVPLGGK